MPIDNRIPSSALRSRVMNPRGLPQHWFLRVVRLGMMRLHRVGLPEVGAVGPRRADRGGSMPPATRVRVWTGASTGPRTGRRAGQGGRHRVPPALQLGPVVREKINRGEMQYFDMHLTQVAPMAWQGFLGPLDTAMIEVRGIRPDGTLIPSSSVGNNKTWLDRAEEGDPRGEPRQNRRWKGCTTYTTEQPCPRTGCRSSSYAR